MDLKRTENSWAACFAAFGFALIISIFMLCPVYSYGTSGVSIQVDGPGSVKVGQTFTVKIVISASSLDSADGQVKYDANGIKYLKGGDSEGSGGIVAMSAYSDDGKRITYNLKMEALKAGSYSISANVDEAYDADGNLLSSGSKSLKLSVSGSSSSTEKTDDQAEPQAVNDSTDDNANLGLKDIANSGSDLVLVCITGGTFILFVIVLIIVIRRRKHR